MIIKYLLLLLLLSVEASLGLPLFAVDLFSRDLPRYQWQLSGVLVMLGSLALAVFYQLSWPLLALLLWLLWSKRWWLRWPMLVVLHTYIFTQAQLNFHWLWLIHISVFCLFLYKKYLRKYD